MLVEPGVPRSQRRARECDHRAAEPQPRPKATAGPHAAQHLELRFVGGAAGVAGRVTVFHARCTISRCRPERNACPGESRLDWTDAYRRQPEGRSNVRNSEPTHVPRRRRAPCTHHPAPGGPSGARGAFRERDADGLPSHARASERAQRRSDYVQAGWGIPPAHARLRAALVRAGGRMPLRRTSPSCGRQWSTWKIHTSSTRCGRRPAAPSCSCSIRGRPRAHGPSTRAASTAGTQRRALRRIWRSSAEFTLRCSGGEQMARPIVSAAGQPPGSMERGRIRLRAGSARSFRPDLRWRPGRCRPAPPNGSRRCFR